MGGGSGGGGSSTTVQKADPWSGVQPYLASAYGQANNLYQPGKGPAYYPGQAVATPNGYETAGQQDMLANMGQLGWIGDNAYQASGNQLSGAQNQLATGQQTQENATLNMQNMGGYLNTATPYGMSALASMMQQAIDSSQGYGMANNAAGTLGQFGANGAMNAGQAGTMNAANFLGAYGANGGASAGQAGTMDAMQKLMAAGDPTSNPYLASAMQSAIRPVTQQFQEQTLPGIKQGAMGAGQLGSSRQGIAEGIAARGYQDTVGDITANMGSQAYAQGLQAMQSAGQLGQGLTAQNLQALAQSGQFGQALTSQGLQALAQSGQLGQGMAGLSAQNLANAGNLSQGFTGMGAGLQGQLANLGQQGQNNALTALGQNQALAGATGQAQLLPGQTMQGIGQQRTADQQAQINAEMAKYNYGQNLPYTMISDYLSLLNGAQGGQTTAQQSGGGGSNRMMGALGGAGTGAAIGSAFAPGIGTAIGAGAGALYGLFM